LNNKWKTHGSAQSNSEIYQLTDTIGSKVIQSAILDNNGNIQPGLHSLEYSSEKFSNPADDYTVNAPKFNHVYFNINESYSV
jgi:hypothetical protein